MKLSKRHSQGIADVYREAKFYLWDGRGQCPPDKHAFICFALSKCLMGGEQEYYNILRARNIIMHRLGESATVYGWLGEREYGPLTNLKLQEYRHRWLDAWIKEFSNI